MGYKMPIVCKDVHLPIMSGDEDLSLEQYKEKYGIDLIDVLGLEINNGAIKTNFKPFTKYYVVADTIISRQFQNLMMAQVQVQSQYEEGTSDAVTIIGGYDNNDEAWCGIELSIDKEVSPSLSNIKIRLLEL